MAAGGTPASSSLRGGDRSATLEDQNAAALGAEGPERAPDVDEHLDERVPLGAHLVRKLGDLGVIERATTTDVERQDLIRRPAAAAGGCAAAITTTRRSPTVSAAGRTVTRLLLHCVDPFSLEGPAPYVHDGGRVNGSKTERISEVTNQVVGPTTVQGRALDRVHPDLGEGCCSSTRQVGGSSGAQVETPAPTMRKPMFVMYVLSMEPSEGR